MPVQDVVKPPIPQEFQEDYKLLTTRKVWLPNARVVKMIEHIAHLTLELKRTKAATFIEAAELARRFGADKELQAEFHRKAYMASKPLPKNERKA